MNGYATAQREYDMMSDEPTPRQLAEENARLRDELDELQEKYDALRDAYEGIQDLYKKERSKNRGG